MDITDAPITVAWEGVLCVEGIPTAERPRRQFASGSLQWGDLPIPLGWERVRSHGGATSEVVNVGQIQAIERRGEYIWGSGIIELDSEYGAQVAARIASGGLGWVSIITDDDEQKDVEIVYAAGCPTESEELTEENFSKCFMPERVIFHSGRVRAADLVDIPAFVAAKISTDLAPHALVAAAATITIPDAPPIEWFQEPLGFPTVGAIELTDEGRFYGYLAPAGVAHRGFQDRKVTVPMGNVDYATWMNRVTLASTEESVVRIVTGAITMGCGHASLAINTAAAAEHYDNSCSLVATACIGENKHGVWIAGALLPGVSADQITRILACQLSGDWRPHRTKRGKREFCGALLVPVPGFAMATKQASVRVRDEALVASAVPMQMAEQSAQCGCTGTSESPYTTINIETVGFTTSVLDNPEPVGNGNAARFIAASVGRDNESRLKRIVSSVRGDSNRL